jgi:hypothetical protein
MESAEYFSSTTEPRIVAKISHVDCLTAELVAADPSQTPGLSQAKSGWKARPRTQIPVRDMAVRLRIDGLDSQELVTASQRRRFFTLNATESIEQPSSFMVIINESDEFEIVDQLGRCIPTLPTILHHKAGSMDLCLMFLSTFHPINTSRLLRIGFPVLRLLSSSKFELQISLVRLRTLLV